MSSRKSRRLSANVAAAVPVNEEHQFEPQNHPGPIGQDEDHPSDADEQAVADEFLKLVEEEQASTTPAAEVLQTVDTAPDATPSAPAPDASTTSSSATQDDSTPPTPAPVVAPPAATVVAEKSKDPRKDTVGSRTARYTMDQCIVVLVSNPKRVGTAGHDRFAIYKDGMTVKQYLEHEAIGKFGRADIAWDLARGFICIENATDVAGVITSRNAKMAAAAAKK